MSPKFEKMSKISRLPKFDLKAALKAKLEVMESQFTLPVTQQNCYELLLLYKRPVSDSQQLPL